MPCKRSRERILIVDKNKDFLCLAQSLLEFAGLRAETAKDGEKALGQVKRLKYDLLVLGAVMPRVAGIKLLHMVRTSKKYAGVPVLFISGYSRKGRLEARVRESLSNTKGYMSKSFKTEGFLEMVTTLLEEKRTADVACS